MSSAAVAAYGVTLEYDSGTVKVGELTGLTPSGWQVDTIDVTNHDSPNAVKEFVAGLIDAGEFNIEGNHIAADAGQQALLTHLVARDARAVTITWPDASTLKGNVYCTKYAAGEAKVDGALPFSATLKWASSPTMAYS